MKALALIAALCGVVAAKLGSVRHEGKQDRLDLTFYARMSVYVPSDRNASVIVDAPYSATAGKEMPPAYWKQVLSHGKLDITVTDEVSGKQVFGWFALKPNTTGNEYNFSLAEFPPSDKAYNLHLWAYGNSGDHIFEASAPLHVVNEEQGKRFARKDRLLTDIMVQKPHRLASPTAVTPTNAAPTPTAGDSTSDDETTDEEDNDEGILTPRTPVKRDSALPVSSGSSIAWSRIFPVSVHPTTWDYINNQYEKGNWSQFIQHVKVQGYNVIHPRNTNKKVPFNATPLYNSTRAAHGLYFLYDLDSDSVSGSYTTRPLKVHHEDAAQGSMEVGSGTALLLHNTSVGSPPNTLAINSTSTGLSYYPRAVLPSPTLIPPSRPTWDNITDNWDPAKDRNIDSVLLNALSNLYWNYCVHVFVNPGEKECQRDILKATFASLDNFAHGRHGCTENPNYNNFGSAEQAVHCLRSWLKDHPDLGKTTSTVRRRDIALKGCLTDHDVDSEKTSLCAAYIYMNWIRQESTNDGSATYSPVRLISPVLKECVDGDFSSDWEGDGLALCAKALRNRWDTAGLRTNQSALARRATELVTKQYCHQNARAALKSWKKYVDHLKTGNEHRSQHFFHKALEECYGDKLPRECRKAHYYSNIEIEHCVQALQKNFGFGVYLHNSWRNRAFSTSDTRDDENDKCLVAYDATVAACQNASKSQVAADFKECLSSLKTLPYKCDDLSNRISQIATNLEVPTTHSLQMRDGLPQKCSNVDWTSEPSIEACADAILDQINNGASRDTQMKLHLMDRAIFTPLVPSFKECPRLVHACATALRLSESEDPELCHTSARSYCPDFDRRVATALESVVLENNDIETRSDASWVRSGCEETAQKCAYHRCQGDIFRAALDCNKGLRHCRGAVFDEEVRRILHATCLHGHQAKRADSDAIGSIFSMGSAAKLEWCHRQASECAYQQCRHLHSRKYEVCEEGLKHCDNNAFVQAVKIQSSETCPGMPERQLPDEMKPASRIEARGNWSKEKCRKEAEEVATLECMDKHHDADEKWRTILAHATEGCPTNIAIAYYEGGQALPECTIACKKDHWTDDKCETKAKAIAKASCVELSDKMRKKIEEARCRCGTARFEDKLKKWRGYHCGIRHQPTRADAGPTSIAANEAISNKIWSDSRCREKAEKSAVLFCKGADKRSNELYDKVRKHCNQGRFHAWFDEGLKLPECSEDCSKGHWEDHKCEVQARAIAKLHCENSPSRKKTNKMLTKIDEGSCRCGTKNFAELIKKWKKYECTTELRATRANADAAYVSSGDVALERWPGKTCHDVARAYATLVCGENLDASDELFKEGAKYCGLAKFRALANQEIWRTCDHISIERAVNSLSVSVDARSVISWSDVKCAKQAEDYAKARRKEKVDKADRLYVDGAEHCHDGVLPFDILASRALRDICHPKQQTKRVEANTTSSTEQGSGYWTSDHCNGIVNRFYYEFSRNGPDRNEAWKFYKKGLKHCDVAEFRAECQEKLWALKVILPLGTSCNDANLDAVSDHNIVERSRTVGLALTASTPLKHVLKNFSDCTNDVDCDTDTFDALKESVRTEKTGGDETTTDPTSGNTSPFSKEEFKNAPAAVTRDSSEDETSDKETTA